MESSGKETSTDPAPDQVQVESLRRAVADLTDELQTVSEKVAGLSRAVEMLAPSGKAAATVGRQPRRRTGPGTGAGRTLTVVITPLPEIAMAAVAETSLRDIDGVVRVISVERTGSKARFTLEREPDIDLVEGMRGSLPVPFRVDTETPDEIVISLQWAWGRPEAM